MFPLMCLCVLGYGISRDALTTSDTLCLLHPQEKKKKEEKAKIALNASDFFHYHFLPAIPS